MTFGEDWGFGASAEECRKQLAAYVDRGGRLVPAAKPLTLGDARFRPQVGGKRFLISRSDSWRCGCSSTALAKQCQPRRCAAEDAGHVEPVARLRARAPQSLAARRRAQQHDVRNRNRRFRKIPASQRNLMPIGKLKEPVQKAVDPGRRRQLSL